MAQPVPYQPPKPVSWRQSVMSRGARPGEAVAVVGIGISVSGLPTFLGPPIIAAGIAWGAYGAWRHRKYPTDLVARVLKVADKVLACAPQGHLQPPWPTPSAYGQDANLRRGVASYGEGKKIARRQGHMNAKLWSQVRDVIEELAQLLGRDYRLEPYVSRMPEPSECVYLSSELHHQAALLTEVRTRPPGPDPLAQAP